MPDPLHLNLDELDADRQTAGGHAPVSSAQVVAELCSFHNVVEQLKVQSRRMGDQLEAGQTKSTEALERIEGLLERQLEALEHLSEQLGLLGGATVELDGSVRTRIAQGGAP